MRPEGLSQCKNSSDTVRNQATTFQLVAQCLYQLQHLMLHLTVYVTQISSHPQHLMPPHLTVYVTQISSHLQHLMPPPHSILHTNILTPSTPHAPPHSILHTNILTPSTPHAPTSQYMSHKYRHTLNTLQLMPLNVLNRKTILH